MFFGGYSAFYWLILRKNAFFIDIIYKVWGDWS